MGPIWETLQSDLHCKVPSRVDCVPCQASPWTWHCQCHALLDELQELFLLFVSVFGHVFSINYENSVYMAVSCEDMSLEVFYSHLQDSSIQFCHFSQMRTCYFEVFFRKEMSAKKQSVNCKFHKNNFSQITMFEASANRHLILSERQRSSEIHHIRFAYYRFAICQGKVQEHS